MNYHQKYLSSCVLAIAALLSAASFQPALAQTAPSLGAASSFAVLGVTAVTCTGPGSITGDVGVFTGGAFTNIPVCTITGGRPPATDAAAVQAHADFLTAYGVLVGQTCTGTLDATLAVAPGPLKPGVYCFTAPGVAFTSKTLTLDGFTNPNGIWIFKVGAALAGTNFQMVMVNGAKPCNVFWAVGGDFPPFSGGVGFTDSVVQGNILAAAPFNASDPGSITITRGVLVGRALANTAVTMTHTSVGTCTLVDQAKASCVADDDDHHENDKDRDHDKDKDKHHEEHKDRDR